MKSKPSFGSDVIGYDALADAVTTLITLNDALHASLAIAYATESDEELQEALRNLIGAVRRVTCCAAPILAESVTMRMGNGHAR